MGGALTAAATALGSFRTNLDRPLGKALDRTNAALGFCTNGKTKQVKAQLAKLTVLLGQYSRALRGRDKKIAPAEVREPLASTADTIKANVKTLRGALNCPADAG